MSEAINPVVDKIAPDGFSFSTTKNIKVNLALKANNNEPLAGVIVSLYLPTGDAIYKGITNNDGILQSTVTVPTSVSKLIIDPAYLGVMRNAQAKIAANNVINATLGGSEGYSGDIIAEEVNTTELPVTASAYRTMGVSSTDYGYPGAYSASNAFVNTTTYPKSLGRPVYLEATPDVVDASLLSYINASLPEGSKVNDKHPEYLSTTAISTINVTKASDIYITFVAEGAGYQSTLGFYTYKTNNPPSSATGGTNNDGIDKITYVFPNASGFGAGGGLKAGDKVKLGNFEAGTSIGFVLMQHSWNGSSVNTGTQKFYSNNDLNPEKKASSRKHAVVLYDDVHKLYLTGIEDLNRQDEDENPNEYESDEDFNDLVFYTTSVVPGAISNNGVPAIDKGGDTDGDGVLDALDAFPNDAARAYVSYYPSATTYANIAFEDNWPKKGDYDLNDLVVSYRYTFTNNAQNQVVDLKGEYSVAASGASFRNGFGVQLPVSASAVSSVNGQLAISNYIVKASNGVEAGQAKAVIIPFDNHEAVLKNPDGAFFINTLATKNKVTSNVATVTVNFASPIAQANLQVASFNPFLISDMRRGYEIHLPGYAPTDNVNSKLFNTDDDASIMSSGKYYISKENWPWAINFSGSFSHPFELQPINEAYPRFSDWATSGGTSFTDWYSNTAAGYRNTTKIYNK